ncbi:MAG TPA: efflux RND transporter periplasmic adaptor subunit [Bacteroidia bacterium]|jgi:membrane fusion protein (multidrug efflux system)|nr:efflux RND transporter periplasmic adaptor subunit [Bacteroidia bacterium]HQF28799.1 efflux RND transporter periplasmic adaptor subunit [Bacteroidia bacterium]HQK96985.1 efflux RND transporter periplasmic adaptor subunit [Bacteroidia bacterium]
MKNYKPVIIVVILAVALFALKAMFFPALKEEAPGGPGKPGASGKPSANVEGYIAKKSVVDNDLYVTGTVVANEAVEVRSEISGKVIAVYFKDGQQVKEGELLLKMEDADLKAQLRKVQAQIVLVKDKKDRYEKLFKIQGVSKEELDASLNELESLQADADVLNVQLKRTSLYAPFNGVIGLKNISVGTYISPQQIVASIQQINKVKIDFAVPEKYSTQVVKGSKINFFIDGNDKVFAADVLAAESSVDVNTRTLMIRALADNSNGLLKPGVFVKVTIKLATTKDALMVPSIAIVPILKGHQVFVAHDGVATATKVKLGVRNDTTIQVIEGVNPDDTIVTVGVMGVRDGTPLKFTSVQ